MGPTGAWSCSNESCHGPSTPGGASTNAPTIDANDAHAAYVALTSFSLNSAPYINACSTDPNASSITCNFNGSCPPTMPQSDGPIVSSPPSEASLRDLNTWLKCGAPFN
jgi:hypothetical protein